MRREEDWNVKQKRREGEMNRCGLELKEAK